MPRRARIIIPDIPLHITQRGNNRQACFFREKDYLLYLEWLEEYAEQSQCLIHAFVLMTNHIHLLLTPKKVSSAGNLMKRLGQRYTQYINRVYNRSGTLWEGRFRSSLVQQEEYLFLCHRYIEMNPVRAGIVNRPEDYRWSSYRTNGFGENSGLITSHPLYENLGETEEERQKSYRELFNHELDPETVESIQKAENGNLAVGDLEFQEKTTLSKMGSVPGDRPHLLQKNRRGTPDSLPPERQQS